MGDIDLELEKLRLVTEETRGNLIQDILGHPKLSPSFDELNYMNPSKSRATLREHLDRLEKEDIVEKILLPKSERKRDNPYTFYTITNSGLKFLEEHNLFVDDLREIREDYDAVKIEDDLVEKCEEAPRPPIAEKRLAEIKERWLE